jgi:hypothetical protein
MEVSLTTGMNLDSKSKGRSNNFSEEEDNLLISAWLNVSQDPVDGNQQKKMQLSGEELKIITMNTGHWTLTTIGHH